MHSGDALKKYIDSTYLADVFRGKRYKYIVNKSKEALILFDAQTPFEAIAFTGMSGSSVAYPLSYLMGKDLLCVRKYDTMYSHSGRKVEGVTSAKNYVIVDDQIDSGSTINNIRDAVADTSKAELVGIYLFAEGGWGLGRWQKDPANQSVRIIHEPFESLDERLQLGD